MRQILTASLMSLALATAPMTATPARAAEAENVVGILLGLGALYAIGRSINRDDDRATPVRRSRPEQPRFNSPDRRRAVPAECLRTFETRNGPVRGFSRECLKRKMDRVNKLPDRCKLKIRTDRGPQTIFAPRCLRREGWRVADAEELRWRDRDRRDWERRHREWHDWDRRDRDRRHWDD